MKQFLSFVRKEFIHILRDPRSLLILLVMPQIMVLLPGYVIKNEVKDIRVAVLDQSRDIYTEQLTQRLYANDYFIGKGEVKTEEEATELFKKGEIDLVVVFGPEFANRIMHSQDASIQILSDGSEPNQASVRVAYAQQVVAGFQKELAQQMAQAGKGGQQFNIQITRSYFSNRNCNARSVFADLASLIWVSKTGTEVNNTVKSCWQAFIPKAVAI
mgnify:CR=1 FL=1